MSGVAQLVITTLPPLGFRAPSATYTLRPSSFPAFPEDFQLRLQCCASAATLVMSHRNKESMESKRGKRVDGLHIRCGNQFTRASCRRFCADVADWQPSHGIERFRMGVAVAIGASYCPPLLRVPLRGSSIFSRPLWVESTQSRPTAFGQ